MKKAAGKAAFLLIISYLLGAAGLLMIYSSLCIKSGALACSNHAEYLLSMPELAGDRSDYSLPRYIENPSLKASLGLRASFSSRYYNGSPSLRLAFFSFSYPLGSCSFELILDARLRP